MNKKNINYGKELGVGIKKGIQGLNTMASPKKRKTCIVLSLFPFIALILAMIGGNSQNDTIIGISMIPLLLSGFCQFYVGNLKKGIIYTFTCGLFCVGALIDLFKLTITRTFRDANGFPVIY